MAWLMIGILTSASSRGRGENHRVYSSQKLLLWALVLSLPLVDLKTGALHVNSDLILVTYKVKNGRYLEFCAFDCNENGT